MIMSIQFMYPGFLWVLFALIIPILIHLFNFRRVKKVYFSNVRFLQDLHIEHHRTSRLKHLLLLLVRILALACIIIAFSRPYIPIGSHQYSEQNKKEIVSIYVDNSFSMNAQGEEGKLLYVAKNKAQQIITHLPTSARLQILSNSQPGNLRAQNREQAIIQLQDIAPSPHFRKLTDVIKRAQLFHGNQNGRHTLFILSDFQKSTTDLDQLKTDTTLNIIFLPLKNQSTNNLYIDTCWFSNPFHKVNHNVELKVRIQNTSEEQVNNIPIKLLINDSIKAVASLQIPAKSSQIVKLKYLNRSKGINKGRVEINDFPITYDNTIYFSYTISPQSKLLCINQTTHNIYLDKLFSDEREFQYQSIGIGEITGDILQQQNLIIFNKLTKLESGLALDLSTYLNQGGNILIIPANQGASHLNPFLEQLSAPTIKTLDTIRSRFSSVETKATLYTHVFEKYRKDSRLPDLFKHFELRIPTKGLTETLWEGPNKHPLLTRTAYGKGNLYLLSMDLNPQWTNVMTHPIFVPTLFNMVLFVNNMHQKYHIIGEDESIFIKNISTHEKMAIHLKNNKLGVNLIPEQRNKMDRGLELFLHGQINQAGNYNIIQDGKSISSVSFNYPRDESQLQFYSKQQLQELIRTRNLTNCTTLEPQLQNVIQKIKDNRTGRPLWMYFIFGCILLLTIETIVLQGLKWFRK